MMTSTFEPTVVSEERRWDRVVAELLSPEAELISVSRWIPDSRAYVVGDRIAVIRMTRGNEARGLENAARANARIGTPHEYVRTEDWEALIMPRVVGTTLEALLSVTTRRERVRLLAKVVPQLRRLHRQGLAHCDLRPDNILVTSGRDVSLVDFDRAQLLPPRRAAIADWLGFGATGPAPKPFWKLVLLTLEPRTRSAYLRLKARLPSGAVDLAPDDPELQLLARAWATAASSGANAPGQRIAYYAFTFKGVHFPGERSWYQRWEPIRRTIDFRNKHVLELGCNMGLFSSFAQLHGATKTIGLDHSESVLEAARLAARALGASAEFQRVDLIADPDWERRFRGADIVAAMSLVHWLPDPDRVFWFLGEHREVIYEGHDPLAIEEDRLRQAGFTHIEVLSKTERGRELLHARR